jgi:hypothetical protein
MDWPGCRARSLRRRHSAFKDEELDQVEAQAGRSFDGMTEFCALTRKDKHRNELKQKAPSGSASLRRDLRHHGCDCAGSAFTSLASGVSVLLLGTGLESNSVCFSS